MHILLVEDNLVIQKIESALLQKLGCQVTIADTGEKALQLIAAAHYQLILMDMELPGMNGLDTTRALRARGVNLPIIAITGNDSDADKQACRMAGMNGFLTKPIKTEQIKAVIDRFS